MINTVPPLPVGFVPGGRLTAVSGNPYGYGGSAGTNIYYSPFYSALVPLWNGAFWQPTVFSESDGTLALGTMVAGQAYDVFGFLSGNKLQLEKLEWANATVTMTIATPCVVTWTAHGLVTGSYVTFTNSGGALPTGITANTQYVVTKVDANTFKLSTTLANMDAGTFVATSGTQSGTHTAHSPAYRATAITSQNGMWCKSGAPTRLLLGALLAATTTTTGIFSTVSGTPGSTYIDVLVANFFNKIPIPVSVIDTTDSWNYQTATWRQSNGASTNRIAMLSCDPFATASLGGNNANLVAHANIATSGSAINASPGIGIDTTLTNIAQTNGGRIATSAESVAKYDGGVPLGYHQLTWLEISQASGTTTWKGDNGLTYTQAGMSGTIMA